MRSRYIAIEGVIGVGKTTLARLLQPRFDAVVLLEVFEENPFLAKFYQDRERFAFQTQLFFLLSRYHQQHQAVPKALDRGTLLTDYTFAKDELFAWLNLRDDELAMYGRVHAALGEKIPKPDLIVYLRASHEVTMRRIMLRDRPYERDMDPEYIRELAAAYDAWLTNLQDTAVLTLDTSDLDFLANADDLEYVIGQIEAALDHKGHADSASIAERELLENGGLSGYQKFHRRLDQSKQFDPDLFFKYVLLLEEVGDIAGELKQVWWATNQLTKEGLSSVDARQEAIRRRRSGLRGELADLLGYTLELANYLGIDLEQAYVEKMRESIDRD
jgi:deoxyguanosine kinase